MDEQAEPEWPAEKVLRLTSLTLGIIITLGEMVWLIDTHVGTRPSNIARHARAQHARLSDWWRRLCIPAEARRLAPQVIWEAWDQMEDF